MKLSAGSTPSFTFPTGCTGPDCLFGLGPTDFATIYNVTPLWKNGIDGTGQTIAIVQDSNIDIQDVRNFRKLFNLPQNDPEIVLDGPDPGLDPDEDEAVLDVEWSGAVAKGAKIKLVVSSGTNTTAGTDLSALYIVDNNISPVMSESFLECELHLGTAGNQFENALWQQAAAEGITAFVASGDGGSAGCDNFNTATVATEGLAVNGLSSTPYNVAVGGTDLLAAVINPTQFFSLTNDPKTQASALSYVPETPWNDSCASALFGSDGVADCNDPTIVPDFLDIVGGSGGVSSCTVSDGENASTCGKSGYPKPVWQTGVGVPKDGKRDIPDVSLFAGNGFLGAFYIFCEADALPSNPTCALDPTSTTDFLGAGGTSFASPNFAGIMAMVNQKTNTRQGNANFVFYRLAANETLANCNSTGASLPASNCIFNDVTFGNNVVPCAAGSPNCTTNGQNVPNGILSGFNAGVGYDLASGLGTVNAANLVNNWRSITFTPTTTTLNLHPTTIMHGQAIRVDVAVNAKGGTPTGQVAIKTDA
jgi:subtilase family serine protease